LISNPYSSKEGWIKACGNPAQKLALILPRKAREKCGLTVGLTVNGRDGQGAVASWRVQQLNLPANTLLTGVHEYRPPTTVDHIVRGF